MLAQARQVHHEGVFKLAVHLLLDLLEIAVAGAFFELAAQQLFPVGPPFDFIHSLAVNQRARAGGREVIALWRAVQILVIEGEGFIVIVNLRQDGVSENLRQHAHFAAEARGQHAVNTADPAALPLILIFPVFRIADTRFGFDVIKPRVLHPFAPGPDVLTGDRAGVAANAFIEIQNHANL
ncbi:Uncharacterised protein [Enterobacter cloacae]|nr:Uncharacterised protein [Enterobacter cloacae]